MKDCVLYNPFFAQDLYQTDQSISAWNTTITTHKIGEQGSSAKWETNALQLLRCDRQTLETKKPCTQASDLTGSYKSYTPKDFKLGDETQKVIHFTFVFQIFVFLQLFNQINSRKIEESELNVFTYFFSNFAFILVWVIEWAVQISMVQVGGVITKCHALNTSQNLFCLALGFVSLPWGLVIKFIPLKFF